jgi:SET domain-containing protein
LTITAPSVCIRDTGTSKGRGAFATRHHDAGETVEVCPVILFSGTFASVPEEVRKILFNWGVLANAATSHCLALGYGSMYNHDNPANMRYEADQASSTLRFVAIRDIGCGEELTINYNAVGGGHESSADTWFAGMGVLPHRPA